MGTVSFCLNISLDGYCDHTIANPDQEVHDYFTGMMDDADLLFFGRVMYQLMFPYWADVANNQSGTADEMRFAERLIAIDKIVVSQSLETAGHNTRIIRDNPAEELWKLKQQPGKKILIDSVSLLPELIAAGLIDEFHLVVHPLMVGKGRKLLDTGDFLDKLQLKLIDTIIFKSGCVALHYLNSDRIFEAVAGAITITPTSAR
jgi:dihydrofolate reductase